MLTVCCITCYGTDESSLREQPAFIRSSLTIGDVLLCYMKSSVLERAGLFPGIVIY